MQFFSVAIFLSALVAGGFVSADAAVVGSTSRHLRMSQAHLSVDTANRSGSPDSQALPVNLAIIADKCKCRFVGLCSCSAAVEFMDCVADACASGTCECQPSDFVESCNGMAETCPSAELGCSQEKATCTHLPDQSTETVAELVQALEKLKERKCMLMNASQAGYINAGARLKEIEPMIQGKLDLIKERGAEAVYMGCSPFPAGNWTVSWIAGEAEPLPPPAPVAAAPKAAPLKKATEPVAAAPPLDPETKRFWIMFAKVSVYLVFVLLCAVLYDKVRKTWEFPQKKGLDHSEVEFGFSYGLFGCFQDLRLAALTCCCPILRWADTMDKANDHNDHIRTIGYWQGLALVLTLYACYLYVGVAAAHPFIAMFFSVAVLAINVFYRQRLRRLYEIDAGSFRTFTEDCMTWLCCPCCAAVQEARQVEATLVPLLEG